MLKSAGQFLDLCYEIRLGASTGTCVIRKVIPSFNIRYFILHHLHGYFVFQHRIPTSGVYMHPSKKLIGTNCQTFGAAPRHQTIQTHHISPYCVCSSLPSFGGSLKRLFVSIFSMLISSHLQSFATHSSEAESFLRFLVWAGMGS